MDNTNLGDDALIADGLDEAIIGTAARRPGEAHVLVYSVARILAILMRDMPRAEAENYFAVHYGEVWDGDGTPIWMFEL